LRAKPNKTGRNASEGHWTKLLRSTMETPAWRALPPVAQALYPWLKLEWRGPDSNNNGSIRFSVRQAAEALGVAIDTAARAFHDLQAKGFIIMKEPAVLGLEGAAKSPAFELTELGGRDGLGPRKLYMQWTEGCDFPVLKAAANNPTGRTRKTKPCPKNYDSPILEIRTKLRALS
jgi:hypothetical protein